MSDSEFDSEVDGEGANGGGEETQTAGKEEGEGELDAARVRDEILNFLDDMSDAEEEDVDSETEAEGGRRQGYHHLPWRSRCWRVSVYVCM